jgi:glycosyltransferase involved in cell wall biosynthesis
MSESQASDEPRRAWREAVKRRIAGLSSAGLVGGETHVEYLAALGMPRDRVFLGYDAVDNGYFATKVAEIRKQRSESRKQFALPDNYFLASARFIEKKNLPRLMQAYALYRQKAESRNQKAEIWDLVLLGDGPLRDSLCALRSALGVGDSIHLPGFKQYPDLPAYYGLAEAFIHSSTTEQWGLVVNEAMASGLAVLVSNRCGCASDLVQEGVNGFTFDPCNMEQLADLMLRISAFNFPLSAFGDASREIISDWGPDRFASGLKAAAAKAIEVGPKRASLVSTAFLGALSRLGCS